MPRSQQQLLKCGRSACDSAADVRGYSRVTHMIYCIPCAQRIDAHNSTEPLFPLLHTSIPDGGYWTAGLIQLPVGTTASSNASVCNDYNPREGSDGY